MLWESGGLHSVYTSWTKFEPFRDTADLCREERLCLCTLLTYTADAAEALSSACACPGKISPKEEGAELAFCTGSQGPGVSQLGDSVGGCALPHSLLICRVLTLSKHSSISVLSEPHALCMTPGLIRRAVDSVCTSSVTNLLYRLKLLTREKSVS